MPTFRWPDGGELTFAEIATSDTDSLVEYQVLDDDGLQSLLQRSGAKSVWIAVNDPGVAAANTKELDDVAGRLQRFATGIHNVATEMWKVVQPEEFQLEVGFTATYKAGFILMATEGEAAMKATFTWKKGSPGATAS